MHFHQLDILLRRIASTEPPDFSGGMDEKSQRLLDRCLRFNGAA